MKGVYSYVEFVFKKSIKHYFGLIRMLTNYFIGNILIKIINFDKECYYIFLLLFAVDSYNCIVHNLIKFQ